jgi:hypothetical protein
MATDGEWITRSLADRGDDFVDTEASAKRHGQM